MPQTRGIHCRGNLGPFRGNLESPKWVVVCHLLVIFEQTKPGTEGEGQYPHHGGFVALSDFLQERKNNSTVYFFVEIALK